MTDVHNAFEIIQKSIRARTDLMDPILVSGLRLFNGFLEGIPYLTIDLFGKTLVITDHGQVFEDMTAQLAETVDFHTRLLPWIQVILVKIKNDPDNQKRNGTLVLGDKPDSKILENGIWYAIDLQLNQDTSFYFDTRNLRSWAATHLGGKTVLNTFAYTGSIGVAAWMAGAKKVIQTDKSSRFLALAEKSYHLNNLPVRNDEFIIRDFFSAMGMLKKEERLFDCAILDPPFFSTTDFGRIDLVSDNKRLINKIRPLVAHHGKLIFINNALFVSGQAYMELLEELCRDGYLEIEGIIDVPEDVTGYPDTICLTPPADPTPFNHTTKIAILGVTRKDKRTA